MFPESIVEKLMWGAGILATAACMAARAHAAILPPVPPPLQIEQAQANPAPVFSLAK